MSTSTTVPAEVPFIGPGGAPATGPAIDLGSLAGLLAHDHELHAYCAPCGRWTVLPLAALVADGLGNRRLPLRVRCRVCGAPGQLQVRPPMPAWSNTNGWMEMHHERRDPSPRPS